MRIYLSLLLLAVINTLHAKKIESVQSGNWTTSSTWKNGILPSKYDSVIIAENNEIVINTDSVEIRYLELKGKIKFNNAYKLKTTIIECTKNAKLYSNYFTGSVQIDSLFLINSTCEIANVNITNKGLCNISGTLLLSSETTKKEFENIYINYGGKWNNYNNGDPSVSGNIINNGTFISCKNTGCTYRFSNTINILGDSTLALTRISCAPNCTLVNAGKLHILLSLDGNPTFINKKNLSLSVSPVAFHTSSFITDAPNNTVIYCDTNEQNIFTTSNGYYENLTLKNGRKILTENLYVKQQLQLNDSAFLTQQTYAIDGMNSAILIIDSTSTLAIGSNDFNTSQGFPIQFKKLLLHRYSTILYQSKSDEKINSSISYGNLAIDDGAVNESIKTISHDSLRIRGNLWIAESSVRLKCNNCDISCDGNWDGIGNLEMQTGVFQLKGNGNNYGILYPGNGEILYNGEENQIIKIGNYNKLIINKNKGKSIIKGNSNTLICKKLLNEKSLLEIGNETITISDSLINKDILHFTSIQQSRTIKHFINQSGAAVVFKVAAIVTMMGDWINKGNFTANSGKIIFSDSIADQNISGNNTFNKIEINKLKKILHLKDDTKTQNEIKITSGKINLENHTLTLIANSKILNENTTNYIYGNDGKIIVNKSVNANVCDSINGIGLIVQSTVNWGNCNFIRKHSNYSIDGEQSIKRQYEIHPSNNSNLDEKVTYFYLPHELQNNNEKQLAIYKSEDEINWQLIAGNKDTIVKCITVNNIQSFSTWTFKSTPDNPLPVKWLETRIIAEEKGLYWSTASEQNVAYFEVQISEDGVEFTTVKTLSACGTCNNINEYYFKLSSDRSPLYIRIKSVDHDGHEEYSAILFNEQKQSFPTIAVDNESILVTNIEKQTMLEIFDTQGKLIFEEKINPNEKIEHTFSAGIYFYRIDQRKGKFILVN
jgi:hypothetical protein